MSVNTKIPLLGGDHVEWTEVPPGSSEWSSKEMAIAHNYDQNMNVANEAHDEFVLFLERNGINNPAILDIGCCNGRFLNSFRPDAERNDKTIFEKAIQGLPSGTCMYSKYHGIDCNAHAIDVAKKHWKNEENVSFDVFDLGEDNLDDLCLEQYDVVYLDSTLTWVGNWREVLTHIVEKVPIVYCNRTNWMTTIYLDCRTSRMGKLGPNADFNFTSAWGGIEKQILRVFPNEESLDLISQRFDRKLIKYREDDYDGNWLDFYAMTKNDSVDVCPLVQQEVFEKRKLGDIVDAEFRKLRKDPDSNGWNTGRGVWFMLNEEEPREVLHGGNVAKIGEDCSLNRTKNRKIIFLPKDFELKWLGDVMKGQGEKND